MSGGWDGGARGGGGPLCVLETGLLTAPSGLTGQSGLLSGKVETVPPGPQSGLKHQNLFLSQFMLWGGGGGGGGSGSLTDREVESLIKGE